MIIDFHTHFNSDQGSISDLIKGMDDNGIDKAVVNPFVPPPGGDINSANDSVINAVKANKSRLIGFISVLPYHPEAPALLEKYVKTYDFVRGLKIIPSIQQFYPSDQNIYKVIEKTIELDIPVLIHTTAMPIPGTRSRYDHPLEVDDLALVFPEAKLVMAHGNPLGYGPAIAGKHENVYMDTTTTFARFSRLIPGLGEDALEFMGLVTNIHGSKKVLFGSDTNPEKLYRFEKNLAPVQELEISREQKSLILGTNAEKLLKIST